MSKTTDYILQQQEQGLIELNNAENLYEQCCAEISASPVNAPWGELNENDANYQKWLEEKTNE